MAYCNQSRKGLYEDAITFFCIADFFNGLLEGLDVTEHLSLYVHLPFCEHRCTFCGCHVVATRRHDLAAEYLDYLEKEIDLICQHMPERSSVTQIHLGVKRSSSLMGFGISSIGEVGGAYVQNAKKLSTYYSMLDSGRLPVERGYQLSADDRVRRSVILSLMCNLYVDFAQIESEFGIRFGEYFSLELAELSDGPGSDNLVVIDEGDIAVTATGQLFLRNICMIFDRYLREKPPEKPMYSRTV